MQGTMTDYNYRLARTRADWTRFALALLGASLVLGNAVYNALNHDWGRFAFYGAMGTFFVALAFTVISRNPRVRRITSWPRVKNRR
jgi:hypothetical protein